MPQSGEVFGTVTISTISLALRISAIDSATEAHRPQTRENGTPVTSRKWPLASSRDDT